MSEQITPEWLESLGGERYLSSKQIGPHVEFFDGQERVIEVGDDGRVWYRPDPAESRVFLANTGTPAEFLALMAGLKWPGVVADDPEMDCTDGAHPAWWRGQSHGHRAVVRVVTEYLNGKALTGGKTEDGLQAVIERVVALRDAIDAARGAGT